MPHIIVPPLTTSTNHLHLNKLLFSETKKESRHPGAGRGLLFHSANDKVRRTQWMPAFAGMTRLNINFISAVPCTDGCSLLFDICSLLFEKIPQTGDSYHDVYPGAHVRSHFLRDASQRLEPVSSEYVSQIRRHSLFSSVYNSP